MFFVFFKNQAQSVVCGISLLVLLVVLGPQSFLCKESSKCMWDQNIWVFSQEAWRGLLDDFDDDDDRFGC